MAAKKKKPTKLVDPGDLFVGSRVRQWGWQRDGLAGVAFLFKQQLKPDEMKEIAIWLNDTADFIDAQN